MYKSKKYYSRDTNIDKRRKGKGRNTQRKKTWKRKRRIKRKKVKNKKGKCLKEKRHLGRRVRKYKEK